MGKNYSKFGLLNRLYEAKRRYYIEGRNLLTDHEYDALEMSIIAIHGIEYLKEYSTVGYDEDRHAEIRGLFEEEVKRFREEKNR